MRYTLKQQFLDELRESDSFFTFNEACYLYIDIQRRRGSRSTSSWRTRPMGISEGPRGVSMNVSRILRKYASREWSICKNGNPRPLWRMLLLDERVSYNCKRTYEGCGTYMCVREHTGKKRNCSRCTCLD